MEMDYNFTKKFSLDSLSNSKFYVPAIIFVAIGIVKIILHVIIFKMFHGLRAYRIESGLFLFLFLFYLLNCVIIFSYLQKKNYKDFVLSLVLMFVCIFTFQILKGPINSAQDLLIAGFTSKSRQEYYQKYSREVASDFSSAAIYQYSPKGQRLLNSCFEYSQMARDRLDEIEKECLESSSCLFRRDQKCSGTSAVLECKRKKQNDKATEDRALYYQAHFRKAIPEPFEKTDCFVKN